MHEGGVCTPLIVSWPAGIADTGVLHEGRYSIIDFMPAFPEVARASYPDTIRGKKTLPLSGVSMLANLKDGTGQTDRMLFWEYEGNRAIRQGRWKLSAKDKKNVEKYLGQSIVCCASWMNEYRSMPEYRHTTRWHGASVDKAGIPKRSAERSAKCDGRTGKCRTPAASLPGTG